MLVSDHNRIPGAVGRIHRREAVYELPEEGAEIIKDQPTCSVLRAYYVQHGPKNLRRWRALIPKLNEALLGEALD